MIDGLPKGRQARRGWARSSTVPRTSRPARPARAPTASRAAAIARRAGRVVRPSRRATGQPAANQPPPANDKDAQADIKPGTIKPIDQGKGQPIDPNAAPQIGLPQDVTVVNPAVAVPAGPGGFPPGGRPGRPGQGNGQGFPGNGPGGVPPNGPGRPGGPGHGGPGFPGSPSNPYGPGYADNNPIGLGLGLILQLGNQLIINSPGMDQQRIANRPDDRTAYERLPGNRYRETITRPDGIRIVTIYNQNGDILRRSRFDRSGHEIVLAYFDDRYDNDLSNWHDPGDDLPPLQLHIPARDYVLDADGADEQDVQDFFAQPPVEPVQRLYSIDEVKRSARIRDMVRRLEIGDLTFDTGQATLSADQVGNLSRVAQAMLRPTGPQPRRDLPHRRPHGRGRLGHLEPPAVRCPRGDGGADPHGFLPYPAGRTSPPRAMASASSRCRRTGRSGSTGASPSAASPRSSPSPTAITERAREKHGAEKK